MEPATLESGRMGNQLRGERDLFSEITTPDGMRERERAFLCRRGAQPERVGWLVGWLVAVLPVWQIVGQIF